MWKLWVHPNTFLRKPIYFFIIFDLQVHGEILDASKDFVKEIYPFFHNSLFVGAWENFGCFQTFFKRKTSNF